MEEKGDDPNMNEQLYEDLIARYLPLFTCLLYVSTRIDVMMHACLDDRQTDRQTGRQTDRQAGRQAGRQADRQAGRQAGKQTDRRTEILGQHSTCLQFIPYEK